METYLIYCIENSDFVCIVNPEVRKSDEKLFLTFKMLKRRYRSSEINEKLRRLEYFNHPFEEGNEIRLLDDIDLPKPLSLESLNTEFMATEDGRGKTNATEREEKKKKKKENENEFDAFDWGKSKNF